MWKIALFRIKSIELITFVQSNLLYLIGDSALVIITQADSTTIINRKQSLEETLE